jgi:hypothetical protein
LRPLLHSSLQLSRWLEELYRLAAAIPPYRNDFCEIMELLLKRYLEECKNQFRSTIDLKYVGECILTRGDIITVLETDPAWVHLINDDPNVNHLFSHFNISQKEKIKKADQLEFDKKKATIVDDAILSMMSSLKSDQNSFSLLINNVSSLILLANLNDSLEWVAEQVTGISRWAADSNTTTGHPEKDIMPATIKTSPPTPHGRRQSVMVTIKKIQKHQQVQSILFMIINIIVCNQYW